MSLTPRLTPYAHQSDCLVKHGGSRVFALLADMGTGKTFIIIYNAAMLWQQKQCDAVLVLAPNGVHTNWTSIELPKHMPPEVRWQAAAWSSGANKVEQAAIDRIIQPSATRVLRILTMNWEALQTKRGQACALAFATSASQLMIACDESDNIKNPQSIRCKFLMDKLRHHSTWRRIMTGTPTDGTPFAIFAQFKFLDEAILGTTNYAVFKATYAEMLQPGNPLLTAIVQRGRLRFVPQIVATGPNGRPKYRNLDKLKQLIAPYSFRVMKKDCLDLPDKIYQSVIFSMTPEQIAVYKKAESEYRLAYGQDDTPFNKLVIATKLSQITSGYYIHPMAKEPVRILGGNPKLDLLVERVAAALVSGEKIIIWARYIIEINDIVVALAKVKIEDLPIHVVQYHGGINQRTRAEAVEAFERGMAQVFVGNQQAGGSGLTLVAASVVMYFSNNYSLRDRLQSEDRAHRIGQTRRVTYIDFAAKGTVDIQVVARLADKKEVADIILDKGFQLFALA